MWLTYCRSAMLLSLVSAMATICWANLASHNCNSNCLCFSTSSKCWRGWRGWGGEGTGEWGGEWGGERTGEGEGTGEWEGEGTDEGGGRVWKKYQGRTFNMYYLPFLLLHIVQSVSLILILI